MADTTTHINDLPDAILSSIISSVSPTRSRNSVSLVCRRWLLAERATRTSLSLRCVSRDLPSLRPCFPSVAHLDLSNLSPWGYPLLLPSSSASSLRRCFPHLSSLTLDPADSLTISLLAPLWPFLSSIKLVRWHPRPPSPLGSDLWPLFHYCPNLSSVDLSEFYYWTDDLLPVLASHPSTAAALTSLNLMTRSFTEGFNTHQLTAIASSCPSLTSLRVACNFDQTSSGCVDDKAILSIAANCRRLRTLHLDDVSAMVNPRATASSPLEYAKITASAVVTLFSALHLIQDLSLDVCRNVRGSSGEAVEALGPNCPNLTSLNLGQFCGASSGVAVCSGLRRLSLKNIPDITDMGIIAVARGCTILTALSIHGCAGVTVSGLRTAVCLLRKTLVELSVSCCPGIDIRGSVRAVEPIHESIERLHIDCFCNGGSGRKRKREEEEEEGKRVWQRLRELSLWTGVGEELPGLDEVGLGECPGLEEVRVKVEGDCRGRGRPEKEEFGLGGLKRYKGLRRLRVDCGEVVGNALTAPVGQMDVSLWERYYLKGVGGLVGVVEVEYWPAYDRDLNQRSVSLAGVGLLGECRGLRRLVVHGTANEHLLSLLLQIPGLRDVQLREDHYPATHSETSSETRFLSCCRFQDALNARHVDD